MPSSVVTLRIPETSRQWLEREARAAGNTVSSTAARLLEEGIRHKQFPEIDFHETETGSLPFVAGTRVAVWLAHAVARDYGFDPEKLAQHFQWPRLRAEAVLGYAKTYAEEMAVQEADHQALFETLERRSAGRLSA